jgi:putative FmdB family regulatory protein
LTPTYDYKCEDCGMTLTIIRGIKDTEHRPVCVNCAKVMPRVYDKPPAVTFKGTGWGKD